MASASSSKVLLCLVAESTPTRIKKSFFFSVFDYLIPQNQADEEAPEEFVCPITFGVKLLHSRTYTTAMFASYKTL